MSISASPALKQVESRIGIPVGSLAEKNYHSVFDVIRQSRKQFAMANASWLGSRGGHAWDLAMGQAQYIRRLFRESRLTQQVREAFPRTLSGHMPRKTMSPSGVQGLVQGGPDWQNQFGENWQAYCQADSPEAYDSPVSYLTWLYRQAQMFEQDMNQAGGTVIKLAERRPDLAGMVVDNNAVNQEIPALQLVNEILGNNIASSISSNTSVDETLASTRYPTLLPYHFPHDQTELSLQKAGVPLEDIIGQTSIDWPWFLQPSLTGTNSNNATELSSYLAPEQQAIITELTQTDWATFYSTNLGLPTAADYTPFEDIDTFTYQLGITVPQTEQLIAGNAGGTTVTLSPNLQLFLENDLSIRGTTAAGVFGSALSLFNRQNSYAWFIPGGISATTLKGDASFSICMRVYMSATPTDNQMPIISNNLIDGNCQGFTFCINSGNFRLEVVDSANTKVNNNNKKSDGADSTAAINTWYFICLTWDSVGRKVNAYYQASSESALSIITVDMTTLTGDITTEDGFTWVLNDSGDFSYYSQHPTPSTLVNCLYDDIGVFDGVLTSEDAQSVATSTTPLPQVSGLSISCTSYYAADNSRNYVAASENYGASFVNALSSPAVNLDLLTSYPAVNLDSLTSYPNGSTATTGMVNNGAVLLDSTKQQYGVFNSDVNTLTNGCADYTIGLWVNMPTGTTSSVPVIANGIYNQQGIFVAQSGFTNLQVTIYDSNGAGKSDVTLVHPADTWFYFALTLSPVNKTLNAYVVTQDGVVTNASIDYSSLSGSVETVAGNAWHLNEEGNGKFYETWPNNTSKPSFDDVTVWNAVLTETQINSIVIACIPAGQTVPAPATACVNNLSDSRMDRFNRMVRLQRWLGLSYEEADLLLRACIAAQGANNTDYTLNTHTLRALGVFRHWQQKYGVTAFQFAAVLHQITPYAISPAVPFLDQIFNSSSLFDEPFTITGETVNYADTADSNSLQIISQLCAGLGLSRAQFRVLADKVATQQGSANAHNFPLTQDVVSAFYRLTMIPCWLGLSFAEGASLFSLLQASDGVWNTLASIPQLAPLDASSRQPTGGDILDTLMALDAAADWAKEHDLSWVKNYLELQPKPEKLIATAATTNLVNSIKQQLPAALLSEQSFAGIPVPDTLGFPNGFTEDDYGDLPGLTLNAAEYQYGVFSSEAILREDSDYTIGFWLKIPTGNSATVGQTPLLANADWYSTGIFISAYGGTDANSQHNQLIVNISDAGMQYAAEVTIKYTPDVWTYFSFALDAKNKKATLYLTSKDGTQTSVSADFSTLSQSIATPAGNTWHLNESGSGVFYKTYNYKVSFSYSDISTWNKVLSSADIATIAKSGQPATKTVQGCSWNYPFTDWMTTLGNLVDDAGLVRKGINDYDTIHAGVQSDIASLNFDAQVDVSQVTDTLTGIIYQAMLTQNGIADSALAQRCNTQLALSPYLYRWAGDSEYRLLHDTLKLNSGETVIDPAVITENTTYLPQLYALEQCAGIASQFSLTPAALCTFLAYPKWLDNAYLDLAPSLSLLHRLSRYTDWLKVALREDAILAYLAWVNGNTPPDAASAAKALAALLDWDGDEVALATAILPGTLAKTVADVDVVMRLQTLSAQTGLSVTPLLQTGSLTPGSVTDTWAGWQVSGEALVAAQTEQ